MQHHATGRRPAQRHPIEGCVIAARIDDAYRLGVVEIGRVEAVGKGKAAKVVLTEVVVRVHGNPEDVSPSASPWTRAVARCRGDRHTVPAGAIQQVMPQPPDDVWINGRDFLAFCDTPPAEAAES